VSEVITLARQTYGSGAWVAGDGSEGPHEAGWLALEVARARVELGVVPTWSLPEAVHRSMQWYRQLADGADARALCVADIEDHDRARPGAPR
jgi:CDP-glucose 4,6-dehydratase